MLRRKGGSSREVVVTGLEMFRKMLDTAKQGDNVGLLLRGIARNEVGRGYNKMPVLEEDRQGNGFGGRLL